MNRIGIGVLALGILACSSPTETTQSSVSHPDEAAISEAEAVEIAQEVIPNGTLIGVEFEAEEPKENDPAAWEVVLRDSTDTRVEVEVDAMTGDVLEIERGPDDD